MLHARPIRTGFFHSSLISLNRTISLRHRHLGILNYCLFTKHLTKVLITTVCPVSYHFTRHTMSWSFFQLLPKSSDNHISFWDKKKETNLLNNELRVKTTITPLFTPVSHKRAAHKHHSHVNKCSLCKHIKHY